MSRASREANRLAAAFLSSSVQGGNGIFDGPEKPRHLLDLGNRPHPEPYVPETAFRPHNKEARRRLGQMVKREIAALDAEEGEMEKLRATLDHMLRTMPLLENRLPNPPILFVSESLSKSQPHMELARNMGFVVRVEGRIPSGHFKITQNLEGSTDE